MTQGMQAMTGTPYHTEALQGTRRGEVHAKRGCDGRFEVETGIARMTGNILRVSNEEKTQFKGFKHDSKESSQ